MAAYRVGLDGTIPLKRIAKQAVREMEGNLILNALRENKWNRRKAAVALNISYRALIYKIREAGLSPKGSRKRAPADLPHNPQLVWIKVAIQLRRSNAVQSDTSISASEA